MNFSWNQLYLKNAISEKAALRLYLFTYAIVSSRERNKSYLGISIFLQSMPEMNEVLMNSKERGHVLLLHTEMNSGSYLFFHG